MDFIWHFEIGRFYTEERRFSAGEVLGRTILDHLLSSNNSLQWVCLLMRSCWAKTANLLQQLLDALLFPLSLSPSDKTWQRRKPWLKHFLSDWPRGSRSLEAARVLFYQRCSEWRSPRLNPAKFTAEIGEVAAEELCKSRNTVRAKKCVWCVLVARKGCNL